MNMSSNDNNNDELPLSTSNLQQEVRIRMGKEGTIAALPPKTVLQQFDEIAQKLRDEPALFQKRPNPTTGVLDPETSWTSWTWNEYRKIAQAFAKSLVSLKDGTAFQPFQTINILGFNAPEWFFSYFGAIAAGGVPVGIYTTNTAEACQYITEHSNATVLVCDSVAQLKKYLKLSSKLQTQLQALVVYGPDERLITAEVKQQYSVPVYTFHEFLKLGQEDSKADSVLQKRALLWKPGHTVTLIYTSGTTGPPKAVMITNDNLTWTVRATLLTTPRGAMDHTDVMISYLPLSHIAAQLIDIHSPIATGCQIYFAQPDALKGSLGTTLKQVQPTIFFGVPRVWEKIYEKLQEVGKATTGVKKILSTWAKGAAGEYWDAKQHESLDLFNLARDLPASYYLSKVLLSQVHKALGFDRCYGFYASAAPMELKIFEYFASLDIPIMEVFGQSECTGPHTTNQYTAFQFGTVGRPLSGTETKCDEATGELCYRGRHIFAGYMNMPDQTQQTIDVDGWLHSGDVCKINEAGFITITGRIKELIITAGGENVSPVLIEEQLKAAMPALSNAMVIGDRRKFLTALFCLRVKVDVETGVPTNQLTGEALHTSHEIGSQAMTTDEARECPRWAEYFTKGLEKANAKAISRAQSVGKYALLSTDFSEKGGELTPTLKLKRAVTANIHADIIEAMYA